MADTDTDRARVNTPEQEADAAPVPAPPEPPTWEPDPNETYSDRGYMAQDGTQRLYTVEEAAELFPSPTLDELKASKLTELAGAAEAASTASFAYDFGQTPTLNDDGSQGAAAGMKHLQMRDLAPTDDQGNWKAVYPIALAAEVGGSTAPIPIRVEENVTALCSPAQALDVLTKVFGRNSTIIVQTMPGLKHAVAVAADATAVAAVIYPAA